MYPSKLWKKQTNKKNPTFFVPKTFPLTCSFFIEESQYHSGNGTLHCEPKGHMTIGSFWVIDPRYGSIYE